MIKTKETPAPWPSSTIQDMQVAIPSDPCQAYHEPHYIKVEYKDIFIHTKK